MRTKHIGRIGVAAAALVLAACGNEPADVEQTFTAETETGGAWSGASIVDAAKAGEAEHVREMLERGSDASEAQIDGTTALMWAVREQHPDVASMLIEAGADVSATNRYGVSALYLAAEAGDAAATRALLEAGADANTALPEGETVLMTAARAGNPEVVGLLLDGIGSVSNAGIALDNAADVNAREGWHGQTALMWAAAHGHADIVTTLVEAGARVDEHSALIDAPEVNPDRQQGGFVYPNIPKGRMTALHFAAREGRLDSAQALIEGGADVDVVDEEGTTPAVLATLNGHLDIAALMLESGADPNLADRWGRTVLFVATDLNTIDANPRPAPRITSELGCVDLVRLALDKGADPNVELEEGLPGYLAQGGAHNPILNEGATPFLRAAMSGDLEVMRILVDAGADPLVETAEREPVEMAGMEIPSNGRTTTLMAAAGVGWRDSISRGRDADAIETIEMLLELGADINAANQQGDTALHGAAIRGSTDIIRFLVENGADLTAKNDKDWMPIDIARGQPDDRIPYNAATTKLLTELMEENVSYN